MIGLGSIQDDFKLLAAQRGAEAMNLQQVAAEWAAHRAGRDYSIWPRGWQPLGMRPGGVDPDDDDFVDEPPSKCSGLCRGKTAAATWSDAGFCNFCGEDGNG